MINATSLATGALGFTIALAWNDAVSKSLGSFFPPQSAKAAARHTIVYAVVITLLVVFVVASINGTRALIFRHTHRNGVCPVARGRGWALPRRAAGPAGPQPIVSLWEPPCGCA